MSQPSTNSIDITNDQDLNAWAQKFNATTDQIRDAVAEVGTHPEDVELHLKGSRASSNSERVAGQIS